MKSVHPLAGALALTGIAILSLALPAGAAAPCNAIENVGAGAAGVSPGPCPGTSATTLGWDVGSGQCNGSFTVVRVGGFPGGALELGMRAEERRAGAVARVGANEYVVQTGIDNKPTPNPARAWWNFQHSISYGGDIETLDSLTFTIRTDAGSSVPAAPADMLALRSTIDDRRCKTNTTPTYAELYQTSQNPVFGWFTSGYATPFAEEGAWTLTLTAVKGASTASVSICVHTPNAKCAVDVAIDLNPASINRKVNTASKSLVPIAILGTATFDPVVEVDPAAVTVRSASVRTSFGSDTNGDGIVDLVLKFRSRDMDKPTPAECSDPNATITLIGQTYGAQSVIGTDLVTWQGPDCQ